MSGFCQEVLGLAPTAEAADDRVTLGAAGTPLLGLVGDPGLAPLDRRAAGLFHTAFLLPNRASLARWLGIAARRQIDLHGASDHRVSEVIYLADPEGNGIEVYADRPVAEWRPVGGQIDMPSDPLDLQDLLAAGGATWGGMPAGSVVGHAHLQVGDTAAAERFYSDLLGFEVTCRYPGGGFFGARLGPTGDPGFAAEAGCYHLYVALICPWASRTLIARKLKKLATWCPSRWWSSP